MKVRAPASRVGSAPAVVCTAVRRLVRFGLAPRPDPTRPGEPPRSKASRTPTRRLLAAYAAILLLGGAALGVVVGVVDAATAPLGHLGGQAVTGAGRGGQLYLTSCAACHGSQGAGTANGPDIRNAGAALADFMLRTGRMPLGTPGGTAPRGTPYFSDADRQALVAYVAAFGQGPAIPNVVVSGADANAGRDIFIANCAACHGPAGGGGAVGGGFVAPALTSADVTTVGEAVVSGPGPMPRFSFSPQELNDLAAYIAFLRDAPHPGGATSPEVGPVTEGFIAGVTLLALLLVARWVGVRRGVERTADGADGGPGAGSAPGASAAHESDPGGPGGEPKARGA